MSEPHNLEATVFVYEHKTTGEVKSFYCDGSIKFNSSGESSEWNHVATLEPRLWIQAHYKEVNHGL